MKKTKTAIITFSLIAMVAITFQLISRLNLLSSGDQQFSGAPEALRFGIFQRFPELADWKRPEGPQRIALQAGHWKNSELPDEFKRLREEGGGTSGGGRKEWEVNLAIARETKEILEEEGFEVEILPATIPPSYWADVFVAIHADGSSDLATSGFKVASSWRDFTGKADGLVSLLEEEYAKSTDMNLDSNVTRNMRGYYAFSWWRYEHALHPMTTAVIIETGFLTNLHDRQMLINTPQKPAQAIADTIVMFLTEEGLAVRENSEGGES